MHWFSVRILLVPLVFCISEHKNTKTHQSIIQVLQTAISGLILEFKLTYWISDHEDALLASLFSEEETSRKASNDLFQCNSYTSLRCYRIVQLLPAVFLGFPKHTVHARSPGMVLSLSTSQVVSD